MDFVGYAALGGLERVTIVAGAIIIGYWGYRLYAGEKPAGLIFMGLAVLVLVGALATGSRHLKTVGEGMQLASAPPPPSTPALEPPLAPDSAATAPSPFAAPNEPAEASLPSPPPESTVEVTAVEVTEGEAPPAPETSETPAAPAASEAVVSNVAPVRLATGQELGGRIVSVKSENVSLEWSADQP